MMRLRMPPTRRTLGTRRQNDLRGRHEIVTSLALPVQDCCLQLLFGLRTLMQALRGGESQPWRRMSALAFAKLTPEIAINGTRRRGALPFRR